ncbi:MULTISPECIES: hypothetical protein [Paraburkholderia]|uniref:Lipoprotein n=1 Tax=Paraburkholderia megapolitana TaxID=420953 RepID=A0A1I3W6L2_9BURK|nr:MULTISPECIES: hypothetical protein [Paraburkholderia]MCX4165946.1 hypothetical protein [Paraburkholderia megapolitana]MDN7161437.1 hypothetical protein [Paraburkholderia sp. CHISQ3]MDQ6498484.1 hypothetical protein [Paraburkholderia megapolitana]QDQ84609.1 hypothetical protein FNZ07_26440 [Paraburkholderia megapolitana]SFK02081.1 hypothetical protein SAMN05192543_11620 [Paraburkholderia megapolitana]
MKTRILLLASVVAAATLSAACTAVYRNADACEQSMRIALGAESADKLKVSHTGVGIDGTRVVVEGEIQKAASEVAVATAASAASEASDASEAAAASAASAASAVSATTRRAGEGFSSPFDGLHPPTAPVKQARLKPGKVPAAVQCTYNRSGLTSFRWLAPPDMVKTNPPSDDTD